MWNIVSITAEQVREEEVSMIQAPVIEFFKKHLSIDVSKVEIVYEDMEKGTQGYYNTLIRNKVFISKGLKGRGLAEEAVIVHELNHLCQNEYNIGISLTKNYLYERFPELEAIDHLGVNSVSDIDELEYEEIYGLGWEEHVEMNYFNKHIEIDSRIAECLYVYEQVGVDGITILIEHLFSCGITGNLEDRLNNMPEGECKDILINELNKRKAAIEYTPLSDEDLEAISLLLA